MPVRSERVWVRQDAPNFTLASIEGAKVSLSDYRGQRCVVVVFLRGLF